MVNVVLCCPIAVRWERVTCCRRVVVVFVPVLVDVLVCDAYVVDDASVLHTLGGAFSKLLRVNGTGDHDEIEATADSVEVWVSQKLHRGLASIRGEVRAVELGRALQRELLQLGQKARVISVRITVQVQAFCRLNWRIAESAVAINLFHVVHEVDIGREALHAERRIISVNYAEG